MRQNAGGFHSGKALLAVRRRGPASATAFKKHVTDNASRPGRDSGRPVPSARPVGQPLSHLDDLTEVVT